MISLEYGYSGSFSPSSLRSEASGQMWRSSYASRTCFPVCSLLFDSCTICGCAFRTYAGTHIGFGTRRKKYLGVSRLSWCSIKIFVDHLPCTDAILRLAHCSWCATDNSWLTLDWGSPVIDGVYPLTTSKLLIILLPYMMFLMYVALERMWALISFGSWSGTSFPGNAPCIY